MPQWPTHPAFGAPPDKLGLTSGDLVELPDPESPLHAQWLAAAARARGSRPRVAALKDPKRLEEALRAGTGGRGAARILGVYGAAGTGRTTVLRGLARALRESGASVALLDADLSSPALRRIYDCLAFPLVVGGLVLPYVADGVRLQGVDAFWPQPGRLPWQGKELVRVLERFREDVLWAQPDFLLVDLPPLGDPRLAEVASSFGGDLLQVQGSFASALAGPPARYRVRNGTRGEAGEADVLLPYVADGDLFATLSTRFLPLASALVKGSGNRS